MYIQIRILFNYIQNLIHFLFQSAFGCTCLNKEKMNFTIFVQVEESILIFNHNILSNQ